MQCILYEILLEMFKKVQGEKSHAVMSRSELAEQGRSSRQMLRQGYAVLQVYIEFELAQSPVH